VAEDLALPSLLAQLLVAYTIECDIEFEHHLPHRTAMDGRGRGTGPWLISMPMWANFLRYLPADGVARGPLTPLSGLVNLDGLVRWGYLRIDAAPGADRARDVVRLTRAGHSTQAAWPRIVEAVEGRWLARFGSDAIAEAHTALDDLCEEAGPDYLPVVGYADGMRVHVPAEADFRAATRGIGPATHLAARLSRVLLAFTVDYEQQTRLSLTMLADVVRVIGTAGARVRDLPLAGGVSKEGTTSAIGFLQRHELAIVGPDPDHARSKRVQLTARGLSALAAHHDRLAAVEQDWRTRKGDHRLARLRAAVGELHARTDSDGRRLLAAGLTPYPECWRAQRPYLAQTQARLADPAAALPRHPMVLHRGGYPDGS
jgi:DNA-binding MarR family transcriptional regulator